MASPTVEGNPRRSFPTPIGISFEPVTITFRVLSTLEARLECPLQCAASLGGVYGKLGLPKRQVPLLNRADIFQRKG